MGINTLVGMTGVIDVVSNRNQGLMRLKATNIRSEMHVPLTRKSFVLEFASHRWRNTWQSAIY